jgi:hypothetical protein
MTVNQYCSPSYDNREEAKGIRDNFRSIFKKVGIPFSEQENAADIFVASSSKGGYRVVVDKSLFEDLFKDADKIKMLRGLIEENEAFNFTNTITADIGNRVLENLATFSSAPKKK